ncbi:GNAT family N-acetyltransferase [Brevibacillus humidisoli]|uniref:GNAT family N-acetyltransferase n=1 Tax=Brevibacillus humidisoli TaxID=2895522 RepID=UPI001E52C98B|nr:GNAT family N-acetyltransferase [Brevibacillus humidisoli]UFJ41690.1 GNAT family N-acetyltransferase [Brevibacillus humidisoli]
MATHLAGLLAPTDRSINPYPTSLISWQQTPTHLASRLKPEVAVDCGWGNLIYGQTFSSHDQIIELFRQESESRRDIAMYVYDPHIMVAKASDLLFIDPSITYRLWLHPGISQLRQSKKFRMRLLQNKMDAYATNKLYLECGMVPSDPDTIYDNQRTSRFVYYVAEDSKTGEVVGSVMGVDHKAAFGDPDNGASLWSLAVAKPYRAWGIGKSLVQQLSLHYLTRGRDYLDLSVLYDNKKAIRLYESLGFCRVPVYAVKRRNQLNRHLYEGGR